jgi:hypothetical protein
MAIMSAGQAALAGTTAAAAALGAADVLDAAVADGGGLGAEAASFLLPIT